MARKKKSELLVEEVITQELNEEETLSEEEISDSNKCEVLIGENFKIVETRYNQTVYEKTICTRKDTEEQYESWILRGYFGTYKTALIEIKELMAKNKRFDKKVMTSIDEFIQITKESYKHTEKLLEGIES